jgi:hypothetical protein
LPEELVLLPFVNGKNLCRRFLPALFLSYPCPLQEMLLAKLFPIFSKLIILLLPNFLMNNKLHQGDLKGAFFLDTCHLLQIPPVFILTQILFNK